MSEKLPGEVSERIGHGRLNGLGKYNRKQDYGDTYTKDEGCQSKESRKMHLDLRFKELYLWIILLLTEFSGACGSERVVPSNTIAVIGDTVRLDCSTDSPQPVYWEKIPFGLSPRQQKTIYFGKHGLNKEFTQRYNVSTSNNTYDLIITNVEMSDAGKYFCIEESGLGEEFSAELVVTESLHCLENIPPVGIVGENIFGIPQRFGNLQCSLKYRGNVEPALRWKRSGSHLADIQLPAIINSDVISSTTVIASAEMNGEVLTCEASLPNDKTEEAFGRNPLSQGLQWVSKPLVVKYAHLINQPIETCSGSQTNLICNPPCNYSVHVIGNGKCICNTIYNFENITFVYANNTYDCETDERTATLGPASMCLIVAGALVVLILTTYIVFKHNARRKLRKKGTSGNSENPVNRRIMNTTNEVTSKIRDEERDDEINDVCHNTNSLESNENDVLLPKLKDKTEPIGEYSLRKVSMASSSSADSKKRIQRLEILDKKLFVTRSYSSMNEIHMNGKKKLQLSLSC